jgi:hypothetical protein
MAETSYNYSIQNDFTHQKVAQSRLQGEVVASSIATRIVRIDTSGDTVSIVFEDALTGPEEATLDLVVSGHSGEPLPPTQNLDTDGNPVFAMSVYGYVQDKTRFHGYRYVAPANTLSIFDEQITTQIRVQGGTGTIKNAVDGDYVEFSIVDKDNVLGLFGTYGLTPGVDVLELDKYIKKYYPADGTSDFKHLVDAAATVFQGLYFRIAYVAVAGGDDRVIKVTYLWYEDADA